MERFRELVPGVLVATADNMTTTTTLVLGNDGRCLLIDPAVDPEDLTALAADLDAAGLRPQAGYATHPHWDHVLWSSAFGDVPRYATTAAVASIESMRDEMVAVLQQSSPGHDLSLFASVTALPGDGSQIPWDGRQAQVVAHDGHAPGHGAVFLPDAGVLIAGDMLSDIEIPLLDTVAGNPLGDYRTGLERLAAVPGVRWLVPGHGHICDKTEFRRRLDADHRYLDLLLSGKRFEDPRCTKKWLRDTHEHQLQEAAQWQA